jgi:hypothetical protein
MRRVALFYRFMKMIPLCASLVLLAGPALGQIQIDLKFTRLQYIAYEPVVAHLVITNLAGRDINLRDEDGQNWFGFEVTGTEGQPIGPVAKLAGGVPLTIATGKQVTRKINIAPLYPVHDFGTYRVRAHVYFADLKKYFYSQTRVFEVTDARPIWQKTVGVPAVDGGCWEMCAPTRCWPTASPITHRSTYAWKTRTRESYTPRIPWARLFPSMNRMRRLTTPINYTCFIARRRAPGLMPEWD